MTKHTKTLRLRIFAGPNGSGKSTVIATVREKLINNHPIDFGLYINADDIAKRLKKHHFSFAPFNLKEFSRQLLIDTALASGLINKTFTEDKFLNSFKIQDRKIYLTDPTSLDRIAQIIADFLREQLLKERKKFSFETVFSHYSKLDFMKKAVKAGYKVYLYFVATEAPEINIMRVETRVKKGGHNVSEDKIRSRYEGALNLLYDASQAAYQVFFFDNSEEEQAANLFAHFKIEKGKKKWDEDNTLEMIPNWFYKYYSNKGPNK